MLVGYFFEKGKGVSKDEKEALKWYTKAAEQGDAYSQWRLGYFFEEGKGVPKDEKEALKWYTKAAEQGHAESTQKTKFINEKKAVKVVP